MAELSDQIKVKPLELSKFDYKYNPNELLLIINSLWEIRGPVSHHIESANRFYETGVTSILQAFKIKKELTNKRNSTDEDKEIDSITCEVVPRDVTLSPPTTMHFRTGKPLLLYPTAANIHEKYYSGSLSFSCDIKATAQLKNGTTIQREERIDNLQISRIPIVVRSIMCNTYGKSKEALAKLGEDPSDPGGYFVCRGEWAVECTENITFNQPKIYRNDGYGNSRARCEFISKPGDAYQNSDMILIRIFKDYSITIEIVRDKLQDVQIPFYLVFRAMGWTSDKEMMDWIIYDYNSSSNKDILNIVVTAMKATYNKSKYLHITDQIEAIRQIISMVPEEMFKYYDLKNHPENYHNAIFDILTIFDTYCLPHIGMTATSRHEKLKFIALLIRKTIMVCLNYIPQTDRDSFRNKRIHPIGENYAKAFKTIFNQTVVSPIKRRMVQEFQSAPFSQVAMANMVRTAIYGDDFRRLMTQTIIAGQQSSLKVGKRSFVNRLSTQPVGRKNQLNAIAVLRQISSSSSADSAKQSERASEMRRIHMSQVGYVCVSHSSTEGMNVGVKKQFAMSTFIAPPSSSEVLKKLISEDPSIIFENQLTPIDISRGSFARVFVNGYLIGYVEDSIKLVNYYRNLRRKLEINPYTTIYWDNVQNEVQFYVDVGRLCRPLIIVYNNQRDSAHWKGQTDKFEQGIAITSEDIRDMYRGTKTIDTLLLEQKIEYITPEEQENYYISADMKQLELDRHNELQEYTHCDIPAAIIGLTAITAPYGNHNQPPRVTYQTSQAKQTCGYYTLNWPYRADKETFLMYCSESPLVCTLSNKFLFANGNNVMVAIATYTGYNQEDSLIVNKSAVERGLFDGSKMNFYKTDLEQKEELGNPDALKTDGIKAANYEKLVNGVVQKGQILKTDDVIIGKFMPLPKGKDDRYSYIDRSIVYQDEEDAIVHNVIVGRNEDGVYFVKVAVRKVRQVAVGDKFCLTPTHNVLCADGWKPINEVTTKDLVATLNQQTQTLEWQLPVETYTFEVDEPIYKVQNRYISFEVTDKHSVYVRRPYTSSYKLEEMKNVTCATYYTSKFLDYTRAAQYLKVECEGFDDKIVPAWYWYYCVGVYYTGITLVDKSRQITTVKDTDTEFIKYNLNSANVQFVNYKQEYDIKITDEQFLQWCKLNCTFNYFSKLSVEHSRAVLLGMLHAEHTDKALYWYTSDQKIIDVLQLLSFKCNGVGRVLPKNNEKDKFTAFIYEDNCLNEFIVSSKNIKQIDYKGLVHCIEVPNHVFLTQHNGLVHWTGNSSRSGQKGICALKMREADMPTTRDGIRPIMIFNPHGMPSRMTVAQLIESLIGNVCAIKGVQVDGTMFKPVDINAIAEELEQLGLNRYGYEHMISGLTGEFIDTMIFFGPVFYQRLLKFVADAEYSVKHALTDAVTHQPLDGQGSSGGLRIGEMERDVISSHGSSRVFVEKFQYHSDGYIDYFCICGKPAIVNHKENVYKCNYCKDNADIVAYPSSWSAKLFRQEMESCNFGVAVLPKPVTFMHYDTDARELSQVEPYNEETLRKLQQLQDEMINAKSDKADE
jgi:DNA-directed RNA polymerase beta subunit